jgi:hypothetical protein
MAALIALLMVAQQLLSVPGFLTEIVPGDLDTTVLQVDQTSYEIAFGPGCEDFQPGMDVLVEAGSGGVATLYDDSGSGQCNVLIGAPVGE